MRSPIRPLSRALPLVLLATGVAAHGVRIVADDEDPQRGSAFAMFSTADIGATRRVQAMVPGEAPIELEIPADFADEVERLVDDPDVDRARGLGQALLAREWQVDDEREARPGGDRTFEEVRMRVVGLDVDGRRIARRDLVDVTVSAVGS